MVRVLRPTLSGSPFSFSTIPTTLASHAKRLHVSAETLGPCSISQQPAVFSPHVFRMGFPSVAAET